MKNFFKNRRVLYISLSVIVLVAAAVIYGVILNKAGNSNDRASSGASGNPYQINYGPPTEEEKSQADNHKDDLVRQTEGENNSPTGNKKKVTPVITNVSQDSQQVTVNGFVSGVIEEGGTCTVTFTKEASRKTAAVQAFANAGNTNCPSIKLNRSELSVGAWNVVLGYNSSNAEGISLSKELTVQ